MFAGLLAVVGALVALTGLFVDGPPIDSYRGPRTRLGDPGDPRLRGHDPRHQSCIGIPLSIPPLGLVPSTFAAFMVSIFGFHRNALAGKPDRRRGDDGILRRAVRLSAAAAISAMALGLSRKAVHD